MTRGKEGFGGRSGGSPMQSKRNRTWLQLNAMAAICKGCSCRNGCIWRMEVALDVGANIFRRYRSEHLRA